MNKKDYYIILIFLSFFTIYYNIFFGIFGFDFVKIKSVAIKKPNNNIISINSTQSKYKNIIPSFIAKLNNNQTCEIDAQNSVMISNIINEINDNNNTKYYVKIENTLKNKKKICSVPMKYMEIILLYILFYLCMIMFSMITMSFIISIYIKLFVENKVNYMNHINDINDINDKVNDKVNERHDLYQSKINLDKNKLNVESAANDKITMSDDYICV